MTREEAINKAINIVAYFEAHFAKSKEAREDATNIIEVLEQEPCEDAISRNAVLKIAQTAKSNWIDNSVLYSKVKALPSVQPKTKTGHWIKISPAGIYECSECHQNVMTSDICAYKYCHGCSAKMESEGWINFAQDLIPIIDKVESEE